MMRALLLTLALAAAGCHGLKPPSADARSPDAAELDLLASVLRDDFKPYVQSNVPLVIVDTFSVELHYSGPEWQDGCNRELLSEAADKIPSDLIGDFCSKNAGPQAVWLDLERRVPMVLVSLRELETLFSAGPNQKPDGWDRFYARYPKSPGIIKISRVGFNHRGDMAMVYVYSQNHWLSGSGSIRVLRRQDGMWITVPASIGPRWISRAMHRADRCRQLPLRRCHPWT
jgi:hypothetical protein